MLAAQQDPAAHFCPLVDKLPHAIMSQFNPNVRKLDANWKSPVVYIADIVICYMFILFNEGQECVTTCVLHVELCAHD